MRNTSQINRWRLILGSYAKKQLSFDGDGMTENGISCMDLEEALDFLYNREQAVSYTHLTLPTTP